MESGRGAGSKAEVAVSPSMEGQNRVKSFQDKRKGAPEEEEKLGSQENNGAVPPLPFLTLLTANHMFQ